MPRSHRAREWSGFRSRIPASSSSAASWWTRVWRSEARRRRASSFPAASSSPASTMERAWGMTPALARISARMIRTSPVSGSRSATSKASAKRPCRDRAVARIMPARRSPGAISSASRASSAAWDGSCDCSAQEARAFRVPTSVGSSRKASPARSLAPATSPRRRAIQLRSRHRAAACGACAINCCSNRSASTSDPAASRAWTAANPGSGSLSAMSGSFLAFRRGPPPAQTTGRGDGFSGVGQQPGGTGTESD